MIMKRVFVLVGLLVAITALSAVYSTLGVSGAAVGGALEAPIGYNNMVCIDLNGERVGCSENTFTNLGKNLTMNMLFENVGAPPDYIALGNGSATTASTTDLDSELVVGDCSGLQRAQATTNQPVSSPESDGNWTLARTFTSGCTHQQLVNTTALYNATAGATDQIFAGNTFTSGVTLSQNDQVTVTWYVWVT